MDHEPKRIYEPLIVPASLDPDAVRIVRRLRRYRHEAYLVGGCVRDLSLGRIPKDFDIATSARPRQIKRLFRNSRIIGRRFKLVHVQFGDKIIEVSTFRKSPKLEEDEAPDAAAANSAPEGELAIADPNGAPMEIASDEPQDASGVRRPEIDAGPADDEDEDDDDQDGGGGDLLIRRDNVFGSAEEDAVRRDFTINALFYDVDENVVIDYVGGTDDLARKVIRTIGDPGIRFQEDPVRILRAIKFAARLGFTFEPATWAAMVQYRFDLQKCAAPRLAEELLKLLSCGAANKAFELMQEAGVLGVILPEIQEFLDAGNHLPGWSLAPREMMSRYLDVVDRVDHGRRVLSNAVLLTALLVGPIRDAIADPDGPRDPGIAADKVMGPFAQRLSISRRDSFRVKQMVVAQSRFKKQKNGRRRRRIKPIEFVRRDYFKDSLDFFRIESEALGLPQDEVRRWTELYFSWLRETNPRAWHRAMHDAPLGDAQPSSSASAAAALDAHEDGDEPDDPSAPYGLGGDGTDPRDRDTAHESGDAAGDDGSEDPTAQPFGHGPRGDGFGNNGPGDGRRGRRRRGRRGRRGRSGGDRARGPDFAQPGSGGEHGRHDSHGRGGPPTTDGSDEHGAPTDSDSPHAPQPFGELAEDGGQYATSGDGGEGGDGGAHAPEGGDGSGDELGSPAPAQRGPHGGHEGSSGPHESGGRRRGRRRRGRRRGDGARQGEHGRPEGADPHGAPMPSGERSDGLQPEHADRNEQSERSERSDRPERSDRNDRGGRHDRNGRGGRDDRGGRGRRGRRNRGSHGDDFEVGDDAPAEIEEIGAGAPAGSNPDDADAADEREIEIDWNAPLPKVGDPGPISVIRTGIDQTERKGSNRRRRKLDGAARELSKEVSDQPSLQAFKMIDGDPRGHECTRPRKPKRQVEDDRKAKDKPFDFVRDFESIESLYGW